MSDSWTSPGGALAPESVKTENLANKAVTGAKLAAGAVSSSTIIAGGIESGNLAEECVTAPKVKPGALVTDPAEKEVRVGAAGVARKVEVIYKGDGVTAAIKVKSVMPGSSRAFAISISKGEAEFWSNHFEIVRPGSLGAAAGECEVIGTASEGEFEVKFGKAPAAGERIYIAIVG